MTKEKYPIDQNVAKNAWIDEAKYKEMYERSVKDPEGFWADQAERLDWIKKWNKVKETSFKKPVNIKWYQGGKLNVSANCIDRHLKNRADKVALL